MRRCVLPLADLECSGLGLGCNNFGRNHFGTELSYRRCAEIVRAALAAGYSLFDTADVYGKGDSERYLGRAVRTVRSSLLITTKFGYETPGAPELPHGRRGYVRWAIAQSLRRLGTDYVDLYVMHRPDPLTPIVETIGYIDELVTEGSVRYLGVSQPSAADLVAAAAFTATGRPGLVAALTHYSLLTRGPETELLPTALRHGIAIFPFFPLEGGMLTGKYEFDAAGTSGRLSARYEAASAGVRTKLRALQTFASERNITLLEVALGTLAATDGVGPILVGATNTSQVTANAAAVEWVPSRDDLDEVRRLAAGLAITCADAHSAGDQQPAGGEPR